MSKQPPQVLIIEDEEMIANMFKHKFELNGFQVILAYSSKQALEILQKDKPDLILLDILLPRQNGISFLEKLKELKDVSKIPVIAISNYETPEVVNRAYDLGVKDYLVKSKFTPAELVEKAKKYLK